MRHLLVLSLALLMIVVPSDRTFAQSDPRLVQTDDGDLWIVTSTGRYRITPQEMNRDDLASIPERAASENGLILDIAPIPAAVASPVPSRERGDPGPVTPESTAERMRQCLPGSRVETSDDHVVVVAPGPPEEQASIWQLTNLAVLEGSEWQAHPSAINVFISFARMPIQGEDADTTTARRVVRNAMLLCFPE